MPTIKARLTSIAEMAMDYTSMVRVFRKGSKRLISQKLYHYLIDLNSWGSESEYTTKHKEFCEWFISHIRLAKKDGRPSWGQAAKVFDISMKVFVYFCNLPSSTQADRILHWLNAAVDGPILKSLRNDFTGEYSILKSVRLKTMKRDQYNLLQRLIKQKATQEEYLPIEWEELTWRRLNRL